MKRLLLLTCIVLFAATYVSALTVNGVQIDADSAKCITCHEDMGIAPKVHDQWAESAHAKNGVGCLSCHAAEEGDFDAFKCPNSDVVIGTQPTPKDCAQCHEKEVMEAQESKHSYPFWLYAPADRAVFEPIVGTKQGCESCHNLSAMNPDGSVGECDICHAKHSFSIEVARQPQTCGECHLGPDHPQTEIYLESKHGNIFLAKGKHWDLGYKSSEQDGIPIEAPVCTTCHMDAAPGVEATHNVSARLSWEAQAPWSYRTIWFEEKLGTWQEKNERMTKVCKNCHAPSFVEDYMLAYDLVNLQYNEIRRQFVKWSKIYEKAGIIKPLKAKTVSGKEKKFSNTVINAGWYTKAAELMYNSWHHEGRRFRMGAAMMGADYVQWHGIWELQHNLQEMIAWGAEHGVKEAKEIYESDSPTKFFTYKIYDLPGGIYSQVTSEQYDVPMLYKVIPNYWEKVQKNVEEAYKQGFLTKARYDRWMERYNNKDKYLGKKYGKHPVMTDYKERLKKELKVEGAPLKKAIGLKLPSPAPYDDVK
jgi:hypothetical protein